MVMHRSEINTSFFGDVMTKFGRLRYEENYPSCMVMMRGSLNAQLAAIDVFETLSFEVKESEDLAQLEERLFQHEKFSSFDDFITKSDMDAIANLIYEKNLTPENLFKMGFTLSWLANSLHHTQGFRTKVLNHKRFDQVYALCEKILVMANNRDANLELAEMYYNGLRGVELRKDSSNIEGAHKWLDKAMELNQTSEMAARVANLKSCDWAADGDLEKAKAFLDEAITIRQSFPKEDQNPFLVANIHSRKAGFLLKGGQLDEANQVIDLAIKYSTDCRGERDPNTDKLKDPTHDNQYFGIYDWKKAQIQLAQGKLGAAMKFINRALETFEHHRQDSEDLIEMALKVKADIEKQGNSSDES